VLACHARASPGGTRAWGRRFVHGGITINRAAQREVAAGFAPPPCGLARAVPGIPPNDALARRHPTHEARQQQPGELRRGFMPCPMRPRPFRAAIQGHQHRECPGAARDGQLDQHRQDDPLMPPSLRCLAGGRAPAIAMTGLAEDVRARAFCNRRISGPPDGIGRQSRGQQKGQQAASQRPCRPGSR
jgi:hypothetical protein